MNKYSANGFTLLEVLIALAIFALISVMCYRQVNSNLILTERIEKKYLAVWIAESTLEEMFIEKQWPVAGETSEDYEIADMKWVVKTDVTDSDENNLRKIEVSVYEGEDDTGGSIVNMTRYIGKN